jgi:hypothetical protein
LWLDDCSWLDGPAATPERVITAGVNIGSLGVPSPHVTLVLVSMP